MFNIRHWWNKRRQHKTTIHIPDASPGSDWKLWEATPPPKDCWIAVYKATWPRTCIWQAGYEDAGMDTTGLWWKPFDPGYPNNNGF